MDLHKEKTGKYYSKISQIPVDDECQDFIMTMKRSKSGFEIQAQFHENDNTVRWVVNQDGVIEELLDSGPGDLDDLEF